MEGSAGRKFFAGTRFRHTHHVSTAAVPGDCSTNLGCDSPIFDRTLHAAFSGLHPTAYRTQRDRKAPGTRRTMQGREVPSSLFFGIQPRTDPSWSTST